MTNDSKNFFLSFNYFILWCFIQNRRLMDYLSKHKLVIIWNQWIFKPFFKVFSWKIDLSSKVLVIIHTFKKKYWRSNKPHRNLSSLNFLVDIGCCLAPLNIKAVIEVFKCDSSDKSAAKTMAWLLYFVIVNIWLIAVGNFLSQIVKDFFLCWLNWI